MESVNGGARSANLVLCTAMAAALLAGCASHAPLASTGGVPQAEASPTQEGVKQGLAKLDERIALAERRVAKSPADPAARIALAQSYLLNGRFESAATTFEDAQALGNTGGGAALAQALSYIGAGQTRDALALLDAHRNEIPASDFGLAISLAGRTREGVEILTDVVRGGDNSPKARQNLAYAYALDGRWAAARVVASQDVPGDQLEARMSEWASVSRPEAYQARVAGLLGAPVRPDPGQPVALALAGRQPSRRAEAVAPPPVVADELPALAVVNEPAVPVKPVLPDAPAIVPATPRPAVKAVVAAARSPDGPVTGAKYLEARDRTRAPALPPAPRDAERTVAAALPVTPAQVETDHVTPMAVRFVSEPVIQRLGKSDTALSEAFRDLGPRVAASSGSHRVQLGSFRTLEGAKRSLALFKARNPELAHHGLEITEARVGGYRYFRVAAEGFDVADASSFCSSVKRRGEGCLDYRDGRRLPGARPGVLFGQAAEPREVALADRPTRTP